MARAVQGCRFGGGEEARWVRKTVSMNGNFDP